MGKPAQRRRDRGSDDEEPEDHDRSGVGAAARASAPIVAEPAPVREPVDLAAVDLDEAVAIAREAIDVGAAITGDVDAHTFKQLVGPVVEQVRAGAAVDGVGLGDVCDEALVGRGRVSEHYGPRWPQAAELAVRYTIVRGGRRVYYEQIHTVPARTGRDHQGFGTHHHEQAAHMVHLAGVALGAADRYCPAAGIQLTTGTRDDRYAEVADPERIASFEEELGRRVPGSLAEHVHDVLVAQRDVRALVGEAMPRLDAIFAATPIDKRTFTARGFARLLVLDALSFGPPVKRRRSSLGVALPGLDPDIIEALERSDRPAIVFAGGLAAGELDGAQPVAWEGCSISDALGTQRTQPFGVEMLWLPDRQLLVRRELGAGASARAWRLVGSAAEDLPTAIAIVDRALHPWPDAALKEAVARCGPGHLKTSQIASQSAWRALLRVADAALLEADSRTRARQARG